jgi:hypothetical protein
MKRSRRKSHVSKLYGISVESYEEMFQNQGGKCAACGNPETSKQCGRVMRLGVDHDHVTGVIRGLLCNQCNRVLGLFRDNPDVIRRALNYLREHESKRTESQIIEFEGAVNE